MASTAQRITPTTRPPHDEVELGGWAVFAAVILFLSGTFSALYGLAAVLNDEVVTVGGSGGVIVWDFTTWGWVQIVVGAVMVAVGLGLLALKGWARWTAVAIALLNAIIQVTIITAFPIWALIVIALDVTVIYQLTVNWRRTA